MDTRLHRAAANRSVLGHPRGVHEAPAPYGSAALVDPLATDGAFLAEQRRQVEAGVLR